MSLNTAVAFYVVLLAVMGYYTYSAFHMDWITDGGRVGPGFFPRIIGVLATVICIAAIVKNLRQPAYDMHEQAGGRSSEGAQRRPFAMALIVGIGFVAFVFALPHLGAILTAGLFLFGMLSYFNRGKWVANIAVSVVAAVALYLLFQTLLNAGLPAGLLPSF